MATTLLNNFSRLFQAPELDLGVFVNTNIAFDKGVNKEDVAQTRLPDQEHNEQIADLCINGDRFRTKLGWPGSRDNNASIMA